MHGILVGYDGSGHSLRALEWAAREAAVRSTPLSVLIVRQAAPTRWTQAAPGRRTQSAAGDRDTEGTSALIEELALKALAESGLGLPQPPITVHTCGGVPADELARTAAGADMIVVGARGAGGFRKLLMGSVCSYLTHHAHCPVVVIPDLREEERS